MANVHPIASTKDTAAEFARLATLDFAPWTGGSRVTSETWKKTFMAAQIALAVMERSKKGLTSAIAEDSMAFDATFDQLTYHADFLDEVAVWSRALMVHSSPWNGRMRYGPSSSWERPHDGGSASSDPA